MTWIALSGQGRGAVHAGERQSADVERSWSRRHMNGQDAGYPYWRHDAPDAAFLETGPSTAAGDHASPMM